MKIGLFIISIILIIGVAVYTWYNRDSDRVILTFATAMLIGALGFITKESISNKAERLYVEFPIVALFGTPRYQPLNASFPYTLELMKCLGKVQDEDLPEAKALIDIEFAQPKYFDAFEFIVVKEIFKRFAKSWKVEAKQTATPVGNSISWNYVDSVGDEVELSKFANNFTGNYFIQRGICNDIVAPFGGRAIFPKGTEFKVDRRGALNGTSILMSNKYIKLELELLPLMSSIGIGEYSKLLLGETAPRTVTDLQPHGHAVYKMHINIEQNIWLNGHPEMEAHRNWANSIIELLDYTFNFEKIHKEHIQQYQLYGSEGIQFIKR